MTLWMMEQCRSSTTGYSGSRSDETAPDDGTVTTKAEQTRPHTLWQSKHTNRSTSGIFVEVGGVDPWRGSRGGKGVIEAGETWSGFVCVSDGREGNQGAAMPHKICPFIKTCSDFTPSCHAKRMGSPLANFSKLRC